MFSNEKSKKDKIREHVQKVDSERDVDTAARIRSVTRDLRDSARLLASLDRLEGEYRVAVAQSLLDQADSLNATAEGLAPRKKQPTPPSQPERDAFGYPVDPYEAARISLRRSH